MALRAACSSSKRPSPASWAQQQSSKSRCRLLAQQRLALAVQQVLWLDRDQQKSRQRGCAWLRQKQPWKGLMEWRGVAGAFCWLRSSGCLRLCRSAVPYHSICAR